MSRAHARRRVRTPVVLQMEAAECGAAALGTVLGFHGCHVPLEELRKACGVSQDGSKASRILQAARMFGMNARAVRSGIEGLAGLPGPVIVFWQFNHFLVLEGWSRGRGRYFLNDPTCGRRSVSGAEFDAGFTGVILVLEPGPDFVRRPPSPGLTEFLRHALGDAPALWLFAALCALLLMPPALAVPALLRIFIDDYYVAGEASWILGLVAGLVVAAGLLIALTGLQRGALARWQHRAASRHTDALLRRLLAVPLWWMNGRSPDEMARRATLPEENTRLVAARIAPAVLGLPVFGAFFLYLLASHALLAAPVLLLSAAGLVLAWNRREREAGRNLAHAESLFAGAASQGLYHAEHLKCGGGPGFLRKLDVLRLGLLQEWQRSVAARHAQLVLQENLGGFGLAILLAGGGACLLAGHLTAGTLIAMVFVWLQANRILGEWHAIPDAVQRLQENCRKISDVPDLPERHTPHLEAFDRLEARELTYGYNRFAAPLLAGISFSIEPGRHLALVGPSGSGKSALLKLLAGLDHPWSGRLMLNGRATDATAFAGCTALLEQVPRFFSGTLEDNLLGASPEAFREALHLTGLAESLDFSPETLRSEFSAEAFSAGERQRLQLACALARRPGLLLLDEAFSALDTQAAAELLRALHAAGPAILQVTHAPEELALADEILVLDGGTIKERGPFSVLARPGTVFHALTGAET